MGTCYYAPDHMEVPERDATDLPAIVHEVGSMFNFRAVRNCYSKPGVSSDCVSKSGRGPSVMGYHVCAEYDGWGHYSSKGADVGKD